MNAWYSTLRRGLGHRPPQDRLAAAEGGPATKAHLRNLRPFVARHWRKGIAGALLVLTTSLLALTPPLITRYLFDDVILAHQLNRLAVPALLLAAVKGLSMLAGMLQEYLFGRLERDVLLDIQGDLLDRTLRFPKSFFDEQQVGYLMPRLLSDVQGLRWFFSGTLAYLASQVLQMVGGAALLFYLEWRLALVVILALPALVVSVRYFSRKLYALSHQGREQEAHAWRRTQESLSAASLIKAFASERYETGRVMSELRQALQVSLEQVVVGSLARVAINAMGELARAVALLAGAVLVILGQWTAGSLLAFYSYLGRVYGPAQALAAANLELQSTLAALARVSALFDIVPEENLGAGQVVERLSGLIEFRDVSFSYDSGEPVLEDVSFAVRPGERVAIVGPSGVGKTTLVSLVLRFYRPVRGEIWFDGQPAADYELASLRRRIGYVAQSTLLLSGTIGDNLRYGNPEASQEQVEQAARVAGIHDFVAGLAEGYNAPVGERGVNLSEGQRQRLAIARALIKDPDILVLDEPTSSLDSLVERSIFDALPTMVSDKTLFVVAHRLSTVQNSDRILLLNEKRLVAMGTHRELLEGNEYYRSLVEKQQIFSPVPAPGATVDPPSAGPSAAPGLPTEVLSE